MKVLVADDDDEILQLLEIALRTAGLEVLTARDGLRTFAHAKKHSPDAILLDINMPGGNGLEVLSLLKSSPGTQNVPVIVISASADPEMPGKVRGLGAVEYISKPFEVAHVVKTVLHHLGQAGSTPV